MIKSPLRIGLLGAGSHCHNEHLPALRHLQSEPYLNFIPAAVCDLNREAAEAAAASVGFTTIYTSLDRMLTEEDLDGIISVTPTPLTCRLTCRILRAGIPVLMEKPLGVSLDEGEEVVRVARETGTPVMVGMNRQHDPVVRWALDRLAELELTPRYARAEIHRKNRREAGFIEDAGLHAVDCLVAALGKGKVEHVAPLGPDCGEATVAHLRFPNANAVLELLPACGEWREAYTFSGDGFLAHIVPQRSARLLRMNLEPEGFARPEGPAGGWTTGETRAFIQALAGNGHWTPTPAAVLESMRLVFGITARAGTKSSVETP
jgi:predicted dehydrogenase